MSDGSNVDSANQHVGLVTGGGSGIGASMGRWLAENHVHAVLADIDESGAKDVAREINDGDGGRALGLRADVTSESSVDRLMEQTRNEFGRLDYLFCNAGISGPVEWEDTTYEAWKQVMDVNLNGVFLVARKGIPLIREQEDTGHIVVTSSISGRKPKPIMMPYRTSKAAVLMLTHCLAGEVGPGIKVNALLPGPFDSPLQRDLYERRARREGTTVEQLMEDHEQSLPLRRSTRHEDILEVLDFLLFQNGFVTGQEFYLDGGGYQVF